MSTFMLIICHVQSDTSQGLALGLYDGISGFFVQPVKGAQKNGIKGFGKGFGRGLGGLICKPIAGPYPFVLDGRTMI